MTENTVQVKYSPNKSQVSDDKLAEFLVGDLSSNLVSIPGIGESSAKKLHNRGISNSFQLFGKFLCLYSTDMNDPQQHYDAFWDWLNGIDIRAYRSSIVHAIAEKTAIMFPTLYSEE